VSNEMDKCSFLLLLISGRNIKNLLQRNGSILEWCKSNYFIESRLARHIYQSLHSRESSISYVKMTMMPCSERLILIGDYRCEEENREPIKSDRKFPAGFTL